MITSDGGLLALDLARYHPDAFIPLLPPVLDDIGKNRP